MEEKDIIGWGVGDKNVFVRHYKKEQLEQERITSPMVSLLLSSC